MSVGLRIRDGATGVVTLEITDRLTRGIGRFNSGSSPGAFSVPDFAMGAGFAEIVEAPPPNPSPYQAYRKPRVFVSGTTISWDFPGVAEWPVLPCDIIYGVY